MTGWTKPKLTNPEDSADEQEGSDGSEADANDMSSWDRRSFKNSKKYLRKIFACFYLSNDYENQESKGILFEMPNFLSLFKLNLDLSLGSWFGKLPWWIRMNIIDNPYDKNKEECGNETDNLFT